MNRTRAREGEMGHETTPTRRYGTARIASSTPLMRRTPLRRRNKWNAKPVHDMATGRSFDSTGEYSRFGELQAFERAGEIAGLVLHPEVVLVAGDRKRRLPEIAWRLDYSYRQGCRVVFEDYKPRPFTPRERLLVKLWRHFGPAELRITGRNGNVLQVVRPNMEGG